MEPTPCKLSNYHAALLEQLRRFTGEVFPGLFVGCPKIYFTEKLVRTDAKGNVLGESYGVMIRQREIWLAIDSPLEQAALVDYGKRAGMGIVDYAETFEPPLREGEQYFVTLLHELRHLQRWGRMTKLRRIEEARVQLWALKEYKKNRERIAEYLDELPAPQTSDLVSQPVPVA